MPRLFNKRTDAPSYSMVYIGRPGPFGNPFTIGEDGTRAEVIAKYEEWLMRNPELLERVHTELPGKDLLCWCAPLPCHGDVLLRLANPLLKGNTQPK